MKKPQLSFESPELDAFLGRWLAGDLSSTELEEWKRILTYDTEFRERFCDWVKCFRDAGWSRGKASIS